MKEIQNEGGQLKPEHQKVVEEYQEGVRQSKNKYYMITVARDGEQPVRSIIFYDNALDAVSVFNSYKDGGFAKDFLTITLYEPNGKINEKILKRPPGIEATFMRRNYLEIADVLFSFKTLISEETYEALVKNISRVFSQDNKRFDEIRFLENCKNGSPK